jgi:hypothetical protein
MKPYSDLVVAFTRRGNPAERLQAFEALASVARRGGPVAAIEIRSAVSAEVADQLLDAGFWFATLAVQNRSIARVEQGVIAVSLGAGLADFRLGVRSLAILHDAAARLGEDPDRYFTEIASGVGGEGAEFIMEFVGRRPEDKTLKSMRYRFVDDAHNPHYEDVAWVGLREKLTKAQGRREFGGDAEFE